MYILIFMSILLCFGSNAIIISGENIDRIHDGRIIECPPGCKCSVIDIEDHAFALIDSCPENQIIRIIIQETDNLLLRDQDHDVIVSIYEYLNGILYRALVDHRFNSGYKRERVLSLVRRIMGSGMNVLFDNENGEGSSMFLNIQMNQLSEKIALQQRIKL